MSFPACRLIPLTIFVALVAAVPADAQRPGFTSGSRLWVSAWAGGFTDLGGYSQEAEFLQFDGAFAWGGGLHVDLGNGMAVGVDGSLAEPEYTRFDRTDPGTELGRDKATVLTLLASARLQGTPGPLGVFLNGGAGIVSWDVPSLPSRNTDLAFTIGIGLELKMQSKAALFAEYGSWWIYHEKDENVVKNTVRGTVLRAGARLGLF